MSIKVRKVGNSRVLTIPSQISLDPRIKYDVFKGRDGALVYLPHRPNPFKDEKYVKAHRYNGDRTGFINMENGHEE